jgi:hypothetical protein
MGKRAVVVRVKKKTSAPAQNNILEQASKILPTIPPFYGVNPPANTHN